MPPPPHSDQNPPTSNVCDEDSYIDQLDGNNSILSELSESESSCESDVYSIPVHITRTRPVCSRSTDRGKPVLKTVKRNNILLQSISLPVIMNINPRSIYNKSEEFSLLLEQYEADIICMSESFERENLPLEELLQLEDYEIISMVKKRNFKGGNPAILINKQKFIIKKICPDPITVPEGVEAIWALVTPKNNSSRKLRHIAICSLYYRGPKSTKKQELYDHIAQTFHFLSAKYGSQLEYILAGDTNRLNLRPILSLSPRLVQAVKVPTRLNPEAILDPIITTLTKYYMDPVTKPPINADVDSNGKPSDHLICLMLPLSSSVPVPPRVYRVVETRPITESGMQLFSSWLEEQRWHDMYGCRNIHKKSEIFQSLLMANFERCFPTKKVKVCDSDQPWVTKSLKRLDRLRKREFFKHKRSAKWKKLNEMFISKCAEEKQKYYSSIVRDLRDSNVSQWYSKVKRMAGQDQHNSDFSIDELSGMTEVEQAETIANHYASISSIYKPIQTEKFQNYLENNKCSPLKVTPSKIEKIIKSMNKKAAAVPGDLPMKIISHFSELLSKPLAHLVNECLGQGLYPNNWKIEYVTPVPKIFPPDNLADLRKISGLLNFSKITDKLLAECIAGDMAGKRDQSQYGNQKNISAQHYLINMFHKILTSLDENSEKKSIAVLLQMVDWSQAFDRLDHTQGIKSFISNGVRPSLIPILISFFENREMRVKWKGVLSTPRALPGGGPQGGTLGIEEYLSQNNDNTDFLENDEKFKFIDDLSTLELINLLSIALASYDFETHVPSDVATGNLFINPDNIKSQGYLEKIEKWTENKQMKLNIKKTNYMIINFSTKYQFNTRLSIGGNKVDQISETKLLGLKIRDDLAWKSNTEMLTKKAYMRMIILKKLVQFNIPIEELIQIYILYVRSVVEQYAPVWHSSITKGEKNDLERTQKVALRIIFGTAYTTYSDVLEWAGLDTLAARRTKLCLNFAKKCVKNERTRPMFPVNEKDAITRNHEHFKVTYARTDRLAKSAIPFMQRLLNAN